MSSAFAALIGEFAATPRTPPAAVKPLLQCILTKLDAAITSGAMAEVRKLADDIGEQADALTAAVTGAGEESAAPALSGRQDAVSSPTDPETFEV